MFYMIHPERIPLNVLFEAVMSTLSFENMNLLNKLMKFCSAGVILKIKGHKSVVCVCGVSYWVFKINRV